MNYTSLFYWVSVADNAKTLFGWFALFFLVILVATILGRFFNDDDNRFDYKHNSKWIWFSTPATILFLSLWVFTPSKKDSLLIVAGGTTLNFLTTDSSSKQLPSELSNWLVTEIKNLSKEAKIELDLKDTKKQVLEEAKKLTSEELLNKMKVDSNFKNIILE